MARSVPPSGQYKENIVQRLSGKVVVITGGGQGIGLSIAHACADEGASVLVTGRDAAKLEDAVSGLRARGAKAAYEVATAGVRADAVRAIAKAVEQFGRLDVLVNNAQTQTNDGAPLETLDDDFIEMNVRSGLYGTIHHMQAAFPHMKDSGGSIINLGSLAGIVGRTGFGAYAATKEGIRGVSRVAAREWGEYGIRVNVLCPVALSPTAADYARKHPEEVKAALKQLALGRIGDSAKDIAPIAVFLASDESKFLTGQTINADGGQVMF